MSKKQRLDQAMVEREICESIEKARAMIMAGDVLVNEQKETTAGRQVSDGDDISLKSKPRFVSRGGEKMDGALESFDLYVSGMAAADFGASTGGFTDCLLQRGIQKVYAIDVGYGILDQRVRTNDRVVVMERTNARHIDVLPEPIDIVVIDVSFISLNLMFPAVKNVLGPNGICVPLIKPQFEAGPENVGERGVVRDPAVHEMVLRKVLGFANEQGFNARGLIASPLKGPNGNVEFLAHLTLDHAGNIPSADQLVADAMGQIPQ